MKLSAYNLGRKAAEYKRLREAGATDERIVERQTEDALVFGVALDDFLTALEPHANKVKTSKKELAKAKEETVNTAHREVCGFLNQIAIEGTTDVAAFQTALQSLGAEAEGWVLMTAVSRDKKHKQCLFTLNWSGWQGRRYYADRPQPAGRKGTHRIEPFPIRQDTQEVESA